MDIGFDLAPARLRWLRASDVGRLRTSPSLRNQPETVTDHHVAFADRRRASAS
jgi:hypothetical protein